MSGVITHKGVVTEIFPDAILVTIRSESACGGCRVRKQCAMGESEDKTLAIPCGTSFLFRKRGNGRGRHRASHGYQSSRMGLCASFSVGHDRLARSAASRSRGIGFGIDVAGDIGVVLLRALPAPTTVSKRKLRLKSEKHHE